MIGVEWLNQMEESLANIDGARCAPYLALFMKGVEAMVLRFLWRVVNLKSLRPLNSLS